MLLTDWRIRKVIRFRPKDPKSKEPHRYNQRWTWVANKNIQRARKFSDLNELHKVVRQIRGKTERVSHTNEYWIVESIEVMTGLDSDGSEVVIQINPDHVNSGAQCA